jgi:hypothetical protein
MLSEREYSKYSSVVFSFEQSGLCYVLDFGDPYVLSEDYKYLSLKYKVKSISSSRSHSVYTELALESGPHYYLYFL